ncbi:uncharacterized protein LOC121974326 [Zingiber officinale]|uniref:uncharacterized protein LOC121974326 n=1 Tax=Zingiber officinale TaxID=94328 RepID=UPI001C4C5818|nr:uncharacterized protein LOC121974326 [Zingiber officinale]XP_042381277.1 uncharacterized protein LOC121974326 [Zingiber officinale]
MMEVLRQNDNQLIVFKLENKATCEEKKDHASPFPEKESRFVDRSLDMFMDDKASTRRNQIKSETSEAMLKIPPDRSGLIEEDTKLYLDKAVAYLEQPDTKVLSNSEVCPVIRNSHFDEGLVSHNTVLFEHNEVKDISAINKNSDLNGQVIVGPLNSIQDLKQQTAIEKSTEDQNSPKLIVLDVKTSTLDLVKNHKFSPNITLEELLLKEGSDKDHCQADAISLDFSRNHQHCIDHEKVEKTKTEEACSMTTTSSIVDPKSDENTGVDKYPSVDTSELLREGCSTFPEMTFESTRSDHSGTESIPHAGVELIVSKAEAAIAMDKGEIRDGQEPLQVPNLTFNSTSTNHSKTEGNLTDVLVNRSVSEAEAMAVRAEKGDNTDFQESLKVPSPTCDSTLDDHSETEANVPVDEVELIVPEVEPTAAVKEKKASTVCQESLHVQKFSVPQLAVLDATADPPRSSFSHSYGADLIISGPRTSSEHIPYSGSISMRSESSTTSTRSFAFPVLQREWNTSPVKMAKARKHRWRFGLGCCKI